MYICLCHAVKESELRAAVDNGHHDIEAVQAELGVASGCGGCREYAEAMIEDHVEASRLGYAA